MFAVLDNPEDSPAIRVKGFIDFFQLRVTLFLAARLTNIRLPLLRKRCSCSTS